MKEKKKVGIYIHGKGGSYLEANNYKDNCEPYEIIGIDYEIDYPWIVKEKLINEYNRISEKYDVMFIIATSIGAYFTMNSLKEFDFDNALFISPIVNMEKLICDMMNWANVSEIELSEKKEIETEFGETLSWKYLEYVRNNPVKWNKKTDILYAEKDNLTSIQTINEFTINHNSTLTIMKNGEHWFHTSEQIEFLNKWMKEKISIIKEKN